MTEAAAFCSIVLWYIWLPLVLVLLIAGSVATWRELHARPTSALRDMIEYHRGIFRP